MRHVLILAALALGMAAGAQAQARTHSGIHLPRPHVPRPHRVHASKSAYRSVRVRRADGAVMTGYRDSLGTHLRGSDGRTIHCQRQTGGADIEVACR